MMCTRDWDSWNIVSLSWLFTCNLAQWDKRPTLLPPPSSPSRALHTNLDLLHLRPPDGPLPNIFITRLDIIDPMNQAIWFNGRLNCLTGSKLINYVLGLSPNNKHFFYFDSIKFKFSSDLNILTTYFNLI